MKRGKKDFGKTLEDIMLQIFEEWIEQAPAVGIWLGQHLGKYPEGVKALVDWWEEWSMSLIRLLHQNLS